MSDLDQLEEKIKKARHQDSIDKKVLKQVEATSDSRAGIQAGVELVGSIAVSTAIGYGLDHWLGTKPLFLILLFFLGVFAGFFNVYRVSQNLGGSVGYSELHRREKSAKTAPEQPIEQRSDTDNKE